MKSDDMKVVQKYWVSGLCTLSGILNTRKHNVSETGPVCILGGDTYSGPVTDVTSFFQQSRCLLSHLRTETDPVSEMLCFLVFRIPDAGQSPETQ
jgi:hypothetical protein